MVMVMKPEGLDLDLVLPEFESVQVEKYRNG
jgi:hypothetical protein